MAQTMRVGLWLERRWKSGQGRNLAAVRGGFRVSQLHDF